MEKTTIIDYFNPTSNEHFDKMIDIYFKNDKEAIEKLKHIKNSVDKKLIEENNRYRKLYSMDSKSFIEYSFKKLKLFLDKDIDKEKIKSYLKRIKEDIKNVKKGKKKKFFLSQIVDPSSNYVTYNHIYQVIKMNEEKKEKFDNLNNEQLARKAGWYNKKEMKDITPLLKWADECYPDYSVELYESQFEFDILQKFFQ